MSLEHWKFVKDLCRCCHSEGSHCNLAEPRIYLGKEEIYLEMLQQTLNIDISSISGQFSAITYTICEDCVIRLRDATSFRSQVLACEEQFKETFQRLFLKGFCSSSDFNVKPYAGDGGAIKVETTSFPVIEDTFGSTFDDDDDDDKTVQQVKIEETRKLAKDKCMSVKIRPRVSLAKSRKKKAAAVKECDGSTRFKRSKTIWPNAAEDPTIKSQVKSTSLTEKCAQITNACALIENSNITPFRSKNRNGLPCFYCRSYFESLEKLKQHQGASHQRSEAKIVLSTYGCEAFVVYVDVTDLKCTICDNPILSLKELKSHLIKTHRIKMHMDMLDKLVPFKLAPNNVCECQICGVSFETFGSIERHMNNHFRNYVCEECGAGFITKYRLKVHVKSMHTAGNNPCEVCSKVFSSPQKLKSHTATVHKLVKRFKCLKCPERFGEYFRRHKHMVLVHGVAPLQYKCNVCDKTFDRKSTLSRHLKRSHLEERDFQCEMCSYKCFTNNELKAHMVKHNGDRLFECSICKKSYARKKTLTEHMRIHNNDKRYACSVCDQAFVQKCSLTAHMKTHHGEGVGKR